MKVSGFTVIRNGQIMGYPVLESIKSILPIVDEFVIGVGQSEDQTKEMIQAINDPKIRIFDSFWDTQKTSGGLILSEKTNEALDQCQGDWCFYLQADEVVHEEDLPKIQSAMEKWAQDPDVQGLLFKYIHFYGSFDVIATSRNWYRNEIRIIKRNSGARSVGDAQGFRINGEKLKVRSTGASIYHYGWVKPPKTMGTKSKLLNRWWHGDKRDKEFEDFTYNGTSYGLRKFRGSHPQIMQNLVKQQDWRFEPKIDPTSWTLNDWNCFASELFERLFRYRIGEYKPYRLLK